MTEITLAPRTRFTFSLALSDLLVAAICEQKYPCRERREHGHERGPHRHRVARRSLFYESDQEMIGIDTKRGYCSEDQ
jgi:hypothetical protein